MELAAAGGFGEDTEELVTNDLHGERHQFFEGLDVGVLFLDQEERILSDVVGREDRCTTAHDTRCRESDNPFTQEC